MLLQLLHRLIPRLHGHSQGSSRSLYLRRAAGEGAEQHAYRLHETELLLAHWALVHRDWRDGRRRSPASEGTPIWDGQPLHGKTVLIHDWPGLGDSLNFVRYVQDLKKLGATTVIEVRPEAASLLARVPGVDATAPMGRHAECDFHVPGATLLLHSMLVHLQRSALAGAAAPYLGADPDTVSRWAPRLESIPGPRVGLSWAGNPGNRNDAIRSIALQALAPLLADNRCSFVSLQVGEAAAQVQSLASERPVLDLSADLRDLEDTAAVIQNLDLVISIDSTVAHLAGGMGRPVWLLRSIAADRRWDLTTDPIHWYPRLRVFSTEQPGDWSATIARAAAALRAL